MVVLGIETSCDDTGAAVVDGTSRRVLGEAIHKQTREHVLHGGICPTIARDLHMQHIDAVVKEAMQNAGLHYTDLDAIATTVRPGLPLSLAVGSNYGKQLALDHRLPFIPIHHMEAHTLTVRMEQQIDFPFLCLLVSGGHCLLVLVKDIDEYQLLGSSMDDAPGEAFDKGARYLNLRSLASFIDMSGGQAIEQLAREGDPLKYQMFRNAPLSAFRDCNFSFAGLKSNFQYIVQTMEKEHGLDGDTALPLPVLRDLCASYQHAVLQHIIRRTHRALVYLHSTGEGGDGNLCNTLVVSGGVASNSTLRQWLEKLLREQHKDSREDSVSWRLVCPSPRLCTDNGVMIAWNGVERLVAGRGVLTRPQDIADVEVVNKSPLGEDISHLVARQGIKIRNWVKLGDRGPALHAATSPTTEAS